MSAPRSLPAVRETAGPAATGALLPGSDPLAGPVAREPVPRVVLLMLICVVLAPIELSVRVGPLFLTASKIFLVIITFWILPQLPKLKLHVYDWLMVAHAGWSALAFMIIYGPGNSIEKSGFYLLEFLVVYLVARIYLKTLGQILSVVNVLFVMVVLNVIAALPEALTGKRFVHDIARSFTGIYYPFNNEKRLGIYRSTGFFEHAILLGVFCSSMLSLIWFTSRPEQRFWKVPLIFMGTFFAASSAPLMVFVLQVWFILLERATRLLKGRLSMIVTIAIVLVLVIESFTGRGLVGIIALVALNPQTTYYRRGQWENAIDDVMRNPIFGFDPPTFTRPDWMTTSIDNYWLLMMMRSGIPSLLFLFACVLIIWLLLLRRKQAPVAFVQMRNGWGMMMLALALTGATVAFFGKLQPLLSFFIAMGAALITAPFPAPRDAPAPAAAPAGGGSPYTRFGPGREPPGRPTRTTAAPRDPAADASPVAGKGPPARG